MGRAFRVLDVCGQSGRSLTLSEVARAAELPKSSAHRIIGQLVDWGGLERVGDRYRLGAHLFELGSLMAHSRLLREQALPFLEDLYEATHETVHLGVLDGLEVLYVDKICGRRVAPASVGTRVGGRMPLPCTGLGKVMLAFSPEGLLEECILRGWERRTRYTLATGDALRREVQAALSNGVALDREESHLGVACVAAPIFERDHVIAAVSITGPIPRFDPAQFVHATKVAAIAISRAVSAATQQTSVR